MAASDLEELEGPAWDAALRELGVRDAYYARGFVEASAPLAGGGPLLLRHGTVVFAVLVRDDPPDVLTPYGYGGPLATGDPADVAAFGVAYEAWCAARGIVSTFAVHHPVLATQDHAAALGWHTSPLAGTVVWRLAGDLEAGMHRHHRRLVRRARASGHVATAVAAPDGLGPFVALYEASMRRNGAADFYFFGPAYWDALLTGVPLVRVDVRDAEGEAVAGVLGMGEPPFLHYHLGGAADAARGTGASHLGLLALAAHGQEAGHEVLHLGGGVGGRADALLEYKERFAPDGLVPAALGKAVHDLAAYERLAGAPGVDWEAFFPAYRGR